MIGKRLVVALALIVACAPRASAGPMLDEILNYMFMDQSVPMKGRQELFDVQNQVMIEKDAPVGQTFVTGPDTDRIVRVRASLLPFRDWKPGEGAELVLWDSPQKNTPLGRYTIWYEYRGFHFKQAEWEINAKVQPNTSYYFEIGCVGDGDGKVCNLGLMNGTDGYPRGQGYLAGTEADFDLCFQIHSKRRPDPVGNLKKAFGRFDLDRPELHPMRQAVESEDFETAIDRTIAYFEARRDPIPTIISGHTPRFNAGFDTATGDLAMQNYFELGKIGEGYAGPDINWRARVHFDERGALKAGLYCLNRYGPRGTLGRAYLSTGNEKYAGKLNDMLLDWFLDNPPPGESNIGGCPWDPVWSSLNTGIRLGHGFHAYSSIHASPNFTSDCRMAFILGLADHADTLVHVGGTAEGNWAFTQNGSLLKFAFNYPEYKNSKMWQDTASERILARIDEDILPDGVEMESAPGYQRFAYNPMFHIHTLLQERGIRSPLADRLGIVLEGQAEYFMYLAMPDGRAPDFGDSMDHHDRGPLKRDADLFGRSDMLYVATAGEEGDRPSELSKMYPYAGVVTMRSDWGDAGRPYEDSRYLMLHGVHKGGHGHRDLNSILAYAYGRELLTDPGPYVYGAPEHELLTRAESHNLLTIDGANQDPSPKAAFEAWSTTPVADYIASSVGYPGGDHVREVFYIRSNGDPGALDYWVVRDTARGSGAHSLEQRWHFPLGEVAVDPKNLTATTSFSDKGNLALLQTDPSRLAVEQTTTKSWHPYGTTDPPWELPTLVYKMRTELPAAIDTVLLPYEGSNMPQVRIEPLEATADGMNSAFKIVQNQVVDLFAYRKPGSGKSLASEGVAFEGERVFVRRLGGKLRSALLVNGTSLTVDGDKVVVSESVVPWIAVRVDESGTKTYTSRKQP